MQNDRPVVQRRVRIEQTLKQTRGRRRVQLHARIDIVLQPRLSLEHDDRAVAVCREVQDSIGHHVHYRLIQRASRPRPASRAPYPLQKSAYLRCEDDRHDDQDRRKRVPQQPVQHRQIQHRRQDHRPHQHHHDAPQQRDRRRPLQQQQRQVDQDRDREDVDHARRLEPPQRVPYRVPETHASRSPPRGSAPAPPSARAAGSPPDRTPPIAFPRSPPPIPPRPGAPAGRA